MIEVITGKKGSGKTKILVDRINEAVQSTTGNLICVEKGMKLTYDISHKVRLVDAEQYELEGYDAFYGFLAGMLAGNYDIKEIFIDGILKIVGRDYNALGTFLDRLDKLSGEDVKMLITVSADSEDLPESVLKYAK